MHSYVDNLFPNEVIEKLIPQFDDFSGKGDRFRDCVSQLFETKIDLEAWNKIKNQGNESLKQSKLYTAIHHYADSIKIALNQQYGL